MKRILLTMLLGILLHQVVNAQIYSSVVSYYAPAGEDLTSSTTITCVKFSGEQMVFISESKSTMCNRLQESPSYYNNKLNKQLENPKSGRKYKSSISTSSKEVYHTVNTAWPPTYIPDMWGGHYDYRKIGDCYTAFSKDLKEMIMWNENNNGEITYKKYYVRIQESELKPKAANRDFLE